MGKDTLNLLPEGHLPLVPGLKQAHSNTAFLPINLSREIIRHECQELRSSHCSVIYKKRQNNKYPAVKELTNKLLHNNDEKDEMGLDALTRQMRHSR